MQHKKRTRGEGTNCSDGFVMEHENRPLIEAQDSRMIQVWSALHRVQNDVNTLTGKFDIIQPGVVQLAEAVEVLRTTLMTFKEEAVGTIVSEIMKHYKPEVNVKEPMPTTNPDRAITEVRSNSAHFNGVREAHSRGKHSDDPSLMIIANNNVNREGVKTRAGKQQKSRQPFPAVSDFSDCSISPGPPPKAVRKSIKEKKKRVSVPAPKKFVRALFNGRTTGGHNKHVRGQGFHAHTIPAGPFIVSATTSKEDIDLLDFIFMDRPPTDIHSNVVVAMANGMHVTRTDLQCVGPKGLLCSLVINMFVSYMNEPGSVSWYLNTYFGVNSTSKKDPGMSTDQWIEHTRRVASLGKFKGQIGKCERIFIPMLEPSKSDEAGHWYLLVIHPKDRYAKILDSAPSKAKATSRQQDARAAMSMLDAIFFDDFIEHSDASLALGSLPFSALEDTGPIQPNATDCGLFVIRNMQRYGSDWAANYDSDAERASLVIDCLRHEKNEVGDLHVIVDQSLLRWRQNENNEMYDLGKTETANKKYGGVSIIEISEDSTQIGIKKCARDTTLGGV